MILLDSVFIHFLYALIIAAEFFILVFGCYEVIKNQNLKPHRKAFWVFVILFGSLIGILAYFSTEGNLNHKKNGKIQMPLK